MSVSGSAEVPVAVIWASRLVISFGVVVAANWAVAVALGLGATGADLSFTLLLLVATGSSAYGLRRLYRWGWLTTLALALGALFFVAPVTGTILLGGGTNPVGTGWDVIFFPLVTVNLVALLVALKPAWREMATGAPGGAH